MEQNRHTLLAFAGLITIGSIWGMTVPLTRIVVSTGHQPLGLIFWQFVVAVLALGAMLWWRGTPVPVTRSHLFYCLVIAFTGTLLPNSFSYMAAARLPAGIMGLMIATVPMISLAMAVAVGNERFRWSRSLGIVLGVAAMMMIALPEASLPSPDMAPWLAVALVAPVCYGIEGNFVVKRSPADLDPMAVLFLASLGGLCFAGPAAFLSGQWVDLFRPWQAPEKALLASSLAHAVAYSGYLWLVGWAGVVFSTQIAYVVTVAAIAISIAFLGESYSVWVWLAAALMLAGLALVQPVGKLPDPEPGTLPGEVS
ncbi:MAG: DMT family transporter [Nitratireductor sp.]|nr:DMT family transporter [Nitratireductor sp.]